MHSVVVLVRYLDWYFVVPQVENTRQLLLLFEEGEKKRAEKIEPPKRRFRLQTRHRKQPEPCQHLSGRL